MERLMYSLRDIKSRTFGPILLQKTDEEAIRNVREAIKREENIPFDQKSMLGKYPEDFELFKIGKFCDESGKVNSEVKCIANCESLVFQKESEE